MSKKSEEDASSFEELGVPWIRGDEDLYALGTAEDAHVLVRHFGSLDDRAEGFRRAGDELAKLCIAQRVGGTSDETMVLALLYLYHHAVELELKLLLLILYKVHGQDGGIPSVHDLVVLWNQARPLLRRRPGDLTDAVDTAISRVIQQLNQATAAGESCRYARDVNGEPLQLPLEFLDLGNIKTVVARVTSFLAWRRDRYIDEEGFHADWRAERDSWM